MAQILVLKLASGEEVIGKVVSDYNEAAANIGVNTTITLEKVRVVAPMQSPDGRIQVSLVPYVFANIDAVVSIATHQVVGVPTGAAAAMEKEYLAQTSSLVLPT